MRRKPFIIKECIYRIRTDGTGRTKLNSKPSYYLNIIDGWIYYIENGKDFMTASNYMFKMKLDGSEKTKISSDIASSISFSDNVYYVNLCNDWIYYCKGQEAGDSAHGSIYRVKTDGTEKRKIVSDKHARNFCIVGKWIYVFHHQHIDESNSIYKLYRISTSGRSKQAIQ